MPTTGVVGDIYTVVAVTGGFNPVAFSIDKPGVCSKAADVVAPNGNQTSAQVTFTGVGTCTIVASTPGNFPKFSASQSHQDVIVRLPQAITFSGPPGQPNPVYGGTHVVTATGGAAVTGGDCGDGCEPAPVTLASETPATCSISNGTVSFIGVGLCQISGNQAGDSKFAPAPTAFDNLLVAPAPLTVTAPTVTLAEGAPVPTTFQPAAFAGFVLGDTEASLPDPIICTAPGMRPGVGVTTISCLGSGFTDGNYLVTVITGTLTIVPALPVTIDGSNVFGTAVVYTHTESLPTGVSVSGTPTCLSVDGGPVGQYAIQPGLSVGTWPIVGLNCSGLTLSGANASSYKIVVIGGSLTVTPAKLTVAAASVSKVYGEPVPPLSATITGFVAGNTPGVVLGSALVTTTASAGSPAGTTWPITPAAGTLYAQNYTFDFVGSTLTVTQAALNVAASSATSTYGEAPAAVTASISGFTNGDTSASLTSQPACGTSATASSPAGTYPTSCSGAVEPNYTISYTDGVQTVGQAALTVIADAKSKTYGGADPAFTWTYSGFKLGDSAANSSIAGTAQCGRTNGESVFASPYTITCTAGGLHAPNYSFATGATSTLTVTKAVLTVNADPKSKAYGGADPSLTSTLTGFKGSDTAADSSIAGAATCTRAPGESVPGSPYLITCTPNTLNAPNYTFATGATSALTVTNAVLSVIARAKSKTYGGADPAFTWTYSGFKLGDSAANSSIAGTAQCGRTSGESVLASPYTITCTPGGLHAPNYSFATGATSTLTVTKAVLTVNADPKSKAYGGADPSLTSTLTGFKGSDTAADSSIGGAATCTRAPGESVPGSPYLITCTPNTLNAPNYSFATGRTAALRVTRAALTITAEAKTKVYGQPNPTFTAVYNNLANGDNPSSLGGALAFTTSAVATSGVGAYRLTPSGLSSANYTIAFVAGVLSITQAAPSIALSPLASPSVFGQVVTMTATVAPLPAGAGVAGGTVTFEDGAMILGGATLSGGQATLGVATLSVGTHNLHAVYSGSSNVAGGGSTSVPFVVNQAPTATTVVAGPTNPTLGSLVTFAATIAPNPPNAVNPTGTVSFFVDGGANPVAMVAVTPAGTASFATSGLGAGGHAITASYSGESRFGGSIGTTLTFTVSCTTTVTGSHAALVLGTGSTCIMGATVIGSIVVPNGALLDIEGATIKGSILAHGASFIRICGSSALGVVFVQSSTGFVLIGDAEDDHCAVNSLAASLNLQANTGGVEAIGNHVRGAVTTGGNSGTGPYPEDTGPDIRANH